MFTVFLVDDDARVLGALARLLHARGYDVQTFSSSQDFLERHHAATPGCVILDVAMPGLDGLALQEALTEGGDHRPVIFLTGKGDIPSSVRAMKALPDQAGERPVSARRHRQSRENRFHDSSGRR